MDIKLNIAKHQLVTRTAKLNCFIFEQDEDSLDEEGRQRLKLKVENTIRWRQSFDQEGKAVKESNARIVRYVIYV